MFKRPVKVGNKEGNKVVIPMGISDLDFELDGCYVSDKAHYVKDDEIDADVIVAKDIMDKYGIKIKKNDEDKKYVLDLDKCRRITAEPKVAQLK